MFDAALIPQNELDAIHSRLAEIEATNKKLASERDQYRQLYLDTLALCRKLEQGILGQKRERFSTSETQLTMSLLGMLAGQQAQEPAAGAADASDQPPVKPPPERRNPTGRKPLPQSLPRIEIEILPPEVLRAGLDAFERIDDDFSETVERRKGSIVVLRTNRPKFVPKGRDIRQQVEVLQAAPHDQPIERGLAGPGLLSETIVKRFDDHLPLHRLERIFGRDGLPLARSTICGWHATLAELASPLIHEMFEDAYRAPYLCVDATGVLVQAADRCRNGHFWVLAAPELHVLFRYSAKHNSAAVDMLLKGYKGYLVADAHAVYDHLYKTGDVIESGCWAHCRRYFFKSLGSYGVKRRLLGSGSRAAEPLGTWIGPPVTRA